MKQYQENFDHQIFIDETTVQSTCNAGRIWYKNLPNETRLGLIGHFKHLTSYHCIGGISRLGPTRLIVFEGHLGAPGFQQL